jgi:hypothetical protein
MKTVENEDAAKFYAHAFDEYLKKIAGTPGKYFEKNYSDTRKKKKRKGCRGLGISTGA